MSKHNEAIRLALADSAAVFERLKHGKPEDHIYHLLHKNCVEALRPRLDQTSAGVGDDPIELNVERIVQIAAAHENYKEYIKVEDGIGISYHTLSEGRLCDFARDVVAEYVAANTSALTQADQPAEAPVAWQVYNPLVKDWTTTFHDKPKADEMVAAGYRVRPLYAVQQQPAEVYILSQAEQAVTGSDLRDSQLPDLLRPVRPNRVSHRFARCRAITQQRTARLVGFLRIYCALTFNLLVNTVTYID